MVFSAVHSSIALGYLMRLLVVIVIYLIVAKPYLDTLQTEPIKTVVNLAVLIIALAFVIGSGKGLFRVGRTFSFRR